MSKAHDWKREGDWYKCQSCNSRVSVYADYASTKYGCKGAEINLLMAAQSARGVLDSIRVGAMSRNNQEAMIDESIEELDRAITKVRGES